MLVTKKDGTHEPFNDKKIIDAVNKSAERCNNKKYDADKLLAMVHKAVDNCNELTVAIIHDAVITALNSLNKEIAEKYSSYHNYRQDFVKMLDTIYRASQKIRYIGDKENANSDSALVATKRCLIFNELNKQMYRKFFMRADELQACKDGYIYIHDQNARLDTLNCFGRSTRFITDKGVKSFYDFCDGDEIKVLSHKGVWRKAIVHSYGWQRLQKVTFKRASGKEKSVLVTPNHRWILKDGSETTELKVGDTLIKTPNVADFEWESLSRTNKKLWCLGFGFGDGAIIDYNDSKIMIIRLCGKKTSFADRFEEVGYSVTYPQCANGDAMVFMNDIHSKELPLFTLNNENIKFFVNGLLCADGEKNKSNHASPFRGLQVTGYLNDYIVDMLNMAGYYVTSSRDLTNQVTNYGVRTKNTIHYQLYSDSGRSNWVVKSITPEKLNPRAQVWCLEVEEDHSFILDGGIPTGNCCLFDMGKVLKGGFEMGNLKYTEPNSIATAFNVMADVILATASQQYGGFTICEVDKILSPYAKKSYQKYRDEYLSIKNNMADAIKWAWNHVERDIEQGYQGIEMTLNSVGSSRGDYPFITFTFGLGSDPFSRLISITMLNVHKKGQGGKPVLFPKLVFLYDKNLHDEGCINHDVYLSALACSAKTMYPDWLSLTGDGYVPSMYKKYGQVVSPMGCRAFLSPWYERGGMEPKDESDTPVFVGRFNMGVVSLHLPMILAKARKENKDFYKVLDYYLEMIRGIHKRTYDYLGELKASVNPVCFCEGGFYGGHLKPSDKIKPLLKAMTASFGITALNELQRLYNGKSLVEDGEFALEVMKYINKYVERIKHEDNILYAIYGTPAENLCFSGDTTVQTYSGYKKIKDITTNDLVYSFNEKEHKIELKPVIFAGKTGENRQVVKVTFDNGQEIICTPNHQFAVRKINVDESGKVQGTEYVEYVPAGLLKEGTRIKSNYITEKHGRPFCSIYHNGKIQGIHEINAEYKLGKKPNGYVIHHLDEDKYNNSFDNLVYWTEAEHKKYHMKDTIGKYCYTSEQVVGENNPFYNKHHTEVSKQLNRERHLGKNNVQSKAIIELDLNGNIINTFESKGMAEDHYDDVSNLSYALNAKYTTKSNPHEYKGRLWYFQDDIENISFVNHTVRSVEYLDEAIDVYDITVADNHNFFVGGAHGVLVHNCGKQIEQFRNIYGIVENVSDKAYVSNSFHCHVSEDINPIEKQDLEGRFWDFFNGGKIQYVRYPVQYNTEAIDTLIKRAMKKGFYEGVNLSLAYCDDCGYEQLEMDVCPKCGSKNITKIDRMNGYLAYSRIHGDTRLNDAKMAEIKDRKSM